MRFPIAFPGKGYRRCRSHLERKILSGQTCRLINSELGARYKREGAEGPFLFINIACITRVFKKRRWTCWSQQLRSSPCCAWSPAPPGRPGRRTLLHSSQRFVCLFVLGSLASLIPRTADPIFQRILYAFTLSQCRVMSLCKLFVYSSTVAISEKSFSSAAKPRPWNCTFCSCSWCSCCLDVTLHFRIRAQYERR